MIREVRGGRAGARGGMRVEAIELGYDRPEQRRADGKQSLERRDELVALSERAVPRSDRFEPR